jgi:hypothetical protein
MRTRGRHGACDGREVLKICFVRLNIGGRAFTRPD